MIKQTLGLALVVSCTLAGCAIDPATSATDETQADLTARKPAGDRHCVMSADSGKVSCFATFPEAIDLATAGRITDTPMDAHTAITDPAFMARIDALTPLTSDHATDLHDESQGIGSIVGVQFSDANFHGSTFTILSGDGCNAVPTPSVTVMPADWNDEISSFRTSRGCWEVLYADGNFSGQRTPRSQSLSYVGDGMNDQGSTIKFFQSATP